MFAIEAMLFSWEAVVNSTPSTTATTTFFDSSSACQFNDKYKSNPATKHEHEGLDDPCLKYLKKHQKQEEAKFTHFSIK